MLKGKGWNLIYWHNHDHPRVLSHYGNDKEFRIESAKMLAITLYFMPGTSITYQGEEIGMTNVQYTELSDFRDVEVFTEYNNFISRGATHEMAMQALRDRSRDNSRSPMQWDSSEYSGFSKVEPFMKVNFNYELINVKNELNNSNSILKTYQYILNLRNKDQDNIIYGDIEFIDLESQKNFIYINKGKTHDYLVIANFTKENISINLEDTDINNFEYFYGNYNSRSIAKNLEFMPYEAVVFRRDK
jgi:glycosidase